MPDTSSISLTRSVEPLLRTERFGRSMEGYGSIESTNSRATAWARGGAPEGSVVVAEHQTAGRGRLGRSWTADQGENLLFSVVLRPALSGDRLGLITVTGALAVAETLDGAVAPLHATIKWPNDVLLRGRKCCGMLLESSFSGHRRGRPDFVVLGIGLNVNQDRFPEALSDQAASLKQAARRPIERVPLFAELLDRLEQHYQSLMKGNDAAIRSAYEARLYRNGQPVTLRTTDDGTLISGTVRGISTEGALLLETDGGLQAFHAGAVTSR
jgi:BirA family biotin operon repressor/biotin-[acetyl-CoA-carboxylase] ligase